MEGHRVTPQQQRILSILEERRERWTRTDQLAGMLNSTPAAMKVAIYKMRKKHKVHIISDSCSRNTRGYRLVG